MRIAPITAALLFTIGSACQTVPTAGAGDAATLFTRELPQMQVMEVRSAGGDVVLTTEAVARPRITREDAGVYMLEVPIGTDRPVRCWLRTDGADAKWLLANVLTDAKQATQSFEIIDTRAGTLGQVGFVTAEARYSIEHNGEQLRGGLVATVFDSTDIVVACLHDEPGYRATFRRVTEGIIKSLKLEVARQPVPPSYPVGKYT